MRVTRALVALSAAFLLVACGGGGGSARNQRPVATDGMVSTPEDVAVVGAVTGTDADADPLTLQIVSAPQKGDVALSATSPLGFTYTPRAHQNGVDTFTFVVADGKATSNTATMSIAIAPLADAPVIQATLSVNEDSPVTVQLATEVDGEALTVDAPLAPSRGTLTLSATTPGLVTYAPAPNFNGSDTFRLHAVDANGLESTQDVQVTVNAVNDAPLATADSARTTPGRAVRIDVLGNDSDVEGSALAVSIVTASPGGTATVSADGSVQFVPRPEFGGTTSFTYQVADTAGGVATAQVTVAVPLRYAAVFQSDLATPGTFELYSSDGTRTTRLNAALQAGESLVEVFTTAVTQPVVAYRRRTGRVNRLRIVDLRQPGVEVDPIPSFMTGSVDTVLLSADGSKVAFTLDAAWKFVDLEQPGQVLDLGTSSSQVLLEPSGKRFFYADIRFTPSLQPSAVFAVDTAVGATSAVAVTPTFNPPDWAQLPFALSPNGATLYFTSMVAGNFAVQAASLLNPPALTLLSQSPSITLLGGVTPDAASFVFKRSSTAAFGGEDIALVKAATPGVTSVLTQATAAGGGLGQFALSDDGARFYYLRANAGTAKQLLYEVDTANPTVSQPIGIVPAVNSGIVNFSLAPDRSKLVYSTLDSVPIGSGGFVAGAAELFVLDLRQPMLTSRVRRFAGAVQFGSYAPDNSITTFLASDDLANLPDKAFVLNVLDASQIIPLHASGTARLPRLVPNSDL